MKKSKFTDAQIAFVLRLADGARAAGCVGPRNDKSPSISAEALVSQFKMDAGTGFEPVTFRL